MIGRNLGSRSGRWAVGCVVAASVVLGAALAPPAQARVVHRAAPATPANGGSYTVWSVPVQCINPLTGQGGLLNNDVLANLVALNPKNKIIPDLATSWKLSNGGKRITFQLRHGVKFSNGHPFTASTAKWSIEGILNPANKSPQAALISSVSKVKVISTYVLEVDLSAPSRTTLEGFFDVAMLDPKAPPSCTSVVSAGPYKYTSVAADLSSATAVANKYHTWAKSWEHNKSGIPYITTIHAKAIQSASTAVSDALSGGLDYMFNVESTDLVRFNGNPDFVVHNTYPPAIWFWEFNTAHAPFNTVAGRKAWAEVIDRSAIIKAAFGGLAKPSYSVVPPSQGDHDPTADKLTPHYNLADATRLIQQNHLTGPYQLLVLGDPQSQAIAQIIQASAAQAGMKIDIVTKAFGDWLSSANSGNFDALTIPFGIGPDPDAMYTVFDPTQCCGKGYAWNNYLSPKIHTLLVKGREAATLKKAKPYYDQFQEIYAKNAVSMGLVIPSIPIVVRKTIKGWNYDVAADGPSPIDLYIKTK